MMQIIVGFDQVHPQDQVVYILYYKHGGSCNIQASLHVEIYTDGALHFRLTFTSVLFLVYMTIFLIVLSNFSYYPLTASAKIARSNILAIHEPGLQPAVIYKGLDFPTDMAFLAPNDILVLEKNNGKVQRVANGNILQDPVLDVNVANENERGMLGIAIAKN